MGVAYRFDKRSAHLSQGADDMLHPSIGAWRCRGSVALGALIKDDCEPEPLCVEYDCVLQQL